MKTEIKALQTLRSEVVASEAWSMLTHKRELLTDVEHETLENMVIELSAEIVNIMSRMGEIETYMKVVEKYGSE